MHTDDNVNTDNDKVFGLDWSDRSILRLLFSYSGWDMRDLARAFRSNVKDLSKVMRNTEGVADTLANDEDHMNFLRLAEVITEFEKPENISRSGLPVHPLFPEWQHNPPESAERRSRRFRPALAGPGTTTPSKVTTPLSQHMSRPKPLVESSRAYGSGLHREYGKRERDATNALDGRCRTRHAFDGTRSSHRSACRD
uniref:Uncharacterized protein n=1 Tax=Mycena chlorophos TaxID=658473 RepID=A0ABQ0KZJ4_MYCCL|nr:predicted protein [Mycena chlorophos]